MKRLIAKRLSLLAAVSVLIGLFLCPVVAFAGERITIDDGDPEFSASRNWVDSSFMGGYGRDSMRVWSLSGGTATYRPNLPYDGSYKVSAHWPYQWGGGFTNVPYTVYHRDGRSTIRVDQKNQWYTFVTLGTFNFNKGTGGYVVLDGSSLGSNYVYADAVRFEYKGPIVSNRAPVLNGIGSRSVNEGSTLQFTISASDPDGDSLSYSASNLPSGASFSSSTRRFSWTPNYNQSGTYQVTFRVSDGALTDSERITITVNNVILNYPPTASASANPTTGYAPLEVQFTGAGTDSDGTIASYIWSLGDGTTSAQQSPIHTYQAVGTYTATLTVTDDDNATDTDSVTITVNNQVPVLDPIGNRQVSEETLLEFTITASDPDNHALTYSAQNFPQGASFNAATQTFSWIPTYEQGGAHQVTFNVTDGMDADSETITITVTNVNRLPVLDSIGNKTVNENELLQFTISASDPDNDQLTYSASNLPTGASFANRTFTWIPDYTQAGVYQNIRFQVTDGTATDSEDITITVSNVNRSTTLTSIGNKTIDEGSLLEFTIFGSDSDGDNLTYSASSLPQGASFSAATQTFSWRPGFDQAGTYTGVHFAVTDGSSTDSEDITITVNDMPIVPPTASASATPTSGKASLEVNFTSSATDPDGFIDSYVWDFGDGETSSQQNPTHIYQDPGAYVAILTVTDNDGATGTDSVVISVVPESALTEAAKIPHLIRFQGRLTDKSKTPLDGSYNITFRIYDTEIGATPLWTETHANLQVTSGIVNVVLGSITSLDLKFDKDYWLGTEVEADGEMTPRQRLTSSAYTYRAEYAAKGGTVAYTGQGEVSYSFSNELSIHLETSPSSVKLYLWGEASIDGNYPDGVEIKINGVDRTSEILALANSNWGSGNSSLGDGTSSHPLVSGANGVTGTGELDITNLVVWSAGEHTIEFSQTGSAKGKIRYNAYVTY